MLQFVHSVWVCHSALKMEKNSSITNVYTSGCKISRKIGLRLVEQFPGFKNALEKWVKGKSNKAFLHFLPNFCHIWWFFKVEHAEVSSELCKIIKYGKNKFSKKWRKALFDLPLTHFAWFWVPHNHICTMYDFHNSTDFEILNRKTG